MITTSHPGRLHRWLAVACTLLLAAGVGVFVRPPAAAAAYVTINGAGSTWSQNAIDSWRRNVNQFGMTVNFAGTGSSDGRNQFRAGTVDWAASDIPYGIKDGNNLDVPPTQAHPFAYMPVTAGGTTFMYNLKIGNQRVTNLRLSGTNIAKIFTGGIRMWNDAAIAADNPGLRLPAIRIVPVVRSEGSGSTAQFTQWMYATQRSLWNSYCAAAGRNPCTQTSVYPIVPGRGMVAQAGDLGVSGYVAQPQALGAIGYVQYSYAIQANFPVAKMLNNGNYYTEPTAGHVAVSLLKAKINLNKNDPNVYLTQDLSDVYTNTDPRTYPLSGYSYMILPVSLNNPMTTAKGETIADFGKYALCQGQTQVNSSATRRCRSTWSRPASTSSARSPGRRWETSPSGPVTTRPSPPTAPTRWRGRTRGHRTATRRVRCSARPAQAALRTRTPRITTTTGAAVRAAVAQVATTAPADLVPARAARRRTRAAAPSHNRAPVTRTPRTAARVAAPTPATSMWSASRFPPRRASAPGSASRSWCWPVRCCSPSPWVRR
ncbi:phosphate ABC transporter substrate-binding protein PstS [Phytohabitans flavus]|uniref:phosphate ABC transporter substrate-binding protein PstS n=1 Tax=Phytohabitans flavus TaxID=1076124 RepID=UPI0036251AF1